MRTATLATCLALLTLLPASANAQSNLLRETNEAIIDPLSRSPIDLDTVIAAAIDANPTLEATRQRLIAAAQAATHVDALPDPRLRTGFYAVPFPSLDALGGQLRIQLAQDLPYPGTLDRRVAVAERETERREHLVEEAGVRIAAAARRAYHALYFAERGREIHHEHLTLVRELSSVAEERYATGLVPQANVLRVLQELTGLFAQLANVDAQLQSSRAVLNALLHRPPNAPIGRPDHDLEEVSAGLVLDDLLASAAGNPTLAAADAAIGREQARVESERHEAKPDFTVMAEWWTADDGMGGRFERYALLATVTLPWVNKRSYSAAVSQARAQKLAAIAERQARFDEVRRDIAAAWHRVTASERIGELYRTTLLPPP